MSSEPLDAEPVERPAELDYGRPRQPWWNRPRWHLALGIGLVAFGYGLTLTYWPGPPLLMACGGVLIGLAVPLPDGGE